MKYKLIHGDSLIELQNIPANSVDSIVTDPPYGFGFMNKGWDKSGIANNISLWKLAFETLKPGGHLIAFSGSRTYHRMACAIEDAGFEIRDMGAWIYGSGFPKSLNVAKAIDKEKGIERKKLGIERMMHDKRGGNFVHSKHKSEIPKYITEPESAEAKQWDGWGTALKPAHEPFVIARKPLAEKTVAQNVLKYGTGAINIDASRVGNEIMRKETSFGEPTGGNRSMVNGNYKKYKIGEAVGRWPANLIHDGSDEVESIFPKDKLGSASRFFYGSKASKKDRDEGLEDLETKRASGYGYSNDHPTVKPTDLMQHLVRLVTPPGGTVLDPFMGSGSTGKACAREGFNFIGIELDEGYVDKARIRIEYEISESKSKKIKTTTNKRKVK